MHGEIRNYYKRLIETFKGRNYLGDVCIHGRIILKWILGSGVTWLRTESSDGLFSTC
jgi:hypothetical protein